MMLEPTERDGMHSVGPLERIPPGEGRRFRVAGEEVAVFRARGGEVLAVQAGCPHRGGPLQDGLTGSGTVVCPLHGRAFDLATGEPLRHDCAALRTYAVEVTPAGEVLVGPGRVAVAGG